MKNPFRSGDRGNSKLLLATALIVAVLALAGCGGALPFDLSQLPFDIPFMQATPTFTPTPVPTPTNTPEPTPTPKPGETPVPPTPTPVPTPQVTIPSGFTPVVDETLGYSLAVPRGYSPFDLRSPQFQNMANTVGMGDAMAPLNDFLDSPDGENLGVIYAADLMGMMFGGLPTVANVFVIPNAPGVTPESLLDFLEANMSANASMLGDVEIRDLNTAVINNMPGVTGSAVADLASVGMDAKLFAKVAAVIANDNIYVLTLATQESNMASKEPEFDQIIGSFRPE
ncbi:MAG: hypothetical protein HC802_19810 [Caldilineaceae bacterium]|nr:hypothetical protein [Caldilineaceae bacterium]